MKLEKINKELDELIKLGRDLVYSAYNQYIKLEFEKVLEKDYKTKEERDKFVKNLPTLLEGYQERYSKSIQIIKIILPSRLEDFKELYKSSTKRKIIDSQNYTVEDMIFGINRERYDNTIIVDGKSGIPKLQFQLNILKSAKSILGSELLNIKSVLQADLFDNELESAKELNKNGFVRGAGAIAGVVLEGHLKQISENHNIKIVQKNPSISDYNDKLKGENIIEQDIRRKIQYLGDIRNMCDHKKQQEPTREKVNELIEGVDYIIKNVF